MRNPDTNNNYFEETTSFNNTGFTVSSSSHAEAQATVQNTCQHPGDAAAVKKEALKIRYRKNHFKLQGGP